MTDLHERLDTLLAPLRLLNVGEGHAAVKTVRNIQTNAKPNPLKYPMQRIHLRHYGHLTEAFMKELKELPEGPEREALTARMANYMKRSLYNWNRDAMDERKVEADLNSYTDGLAHLPEDFHYAPVSIGHLPKEETSGGKKKKKRKK